MNTNTIGAFALLSWALCAAVHAEVKEVAVERLLAAGPIGSFKAKSQAVYSVELSLDVDTPAAAGAVALSVRWLDSEGKDLAEIEKRLGYKQCTLSAGAPLPDKPGTVTLTARGQASKERCERGIVELLLPPGMDKGARFTLSVKEGVPESAAAQDAGAGGAVVSTPPPGFNFADNLLPDASFESGAAGWRHEGQGGSKIGAGALAGKRCLLLDTEGAWVSDYAEVKPGLPVWFSYWIKFNEFANPGLHPTPVKIEFFKKSGDKMTPIPSANYGSNDFRFDLLGQCLPLHGQWLFRLFGPVAVPAGATHLRGVVEYRNQTSGNLANWGEMRVDNVAAWQTPQEHALNLELKSPDYGKFLRAIASGTVLPPFIPVGAARDNSVGIFSTVIPHVGFYLKGESPAPEIDVSLANYLPVERGVSLEFKLLDWMGNELRTVKTQVNLPPYAVVRKRVPLEASLPFGVYSVEGKALEAARACGGGVLHFAWMEKPGGKDAERLSADYPFCMHPYNITADDHSSFDPDFIDCQLGALRLIGVRAIRLQSRYVYNGLDLKCLDASVKAARLKVERWRETVLPLMRKHGVDGWVSLMEQELPQNAPRTPDELNVWYQYNLEMFKQFGSDITTYCFGNEGLDIRLPENPDEMMSGKSMYRGSARDWMVSYKLARAAAKAVNPKCVFGPSHSADDDGTIVGKFYNILGPDAKFEHWGFNTYSGDEAMAGRRAVNYLAVMNAHGDSAPTVTINEIGIGALEYGPNRAKSERDQAVGLLKTHVAMLQLAPRVKRIDWFIANGAKGGEGHPLFDLCWTPRPAAGAYMAMTERLGAGTVERKIDFPGVEFYVWRKVDGDEVGIAWAQAEAAVTINVGSEEIQVDDLFGNRRTVKAKNGVANLTLSPEPVYVLGAKHLDIANSIELSAAVSTLHGDGPAAVTVTVANNTRVPARITLEALPHPCLKVEPPTVSCDVGAGDKARETFKVSPLLADDRRRFPVKFKATTAEGNVFETVLASSFARCVHAPAAFKLDGTWKGWERAQVLHADQRSQVEEFSGFGWKGADDCSAEIRTMWDERNFYLGVKVKDDVFFAQQAPSSLFLNDALELGFALDERDALRQLSFGQSNEGAVLFRNRPAPGARIELEPAMKVVTPGVYQVAIPWEAFSGFKPRPGGQFRFGVIVDDSDGKPNDRRFISWFGLGIHKNNAKELGDLSLVEP